ncbi:C-GCAxxG-C-C family (seleno)protein [Spirochaetota bacterium]
MTGVVAKEHFLGENKNKRLNCAQAVAMAFKDTLPFITDDTIKQFKKKGFGKAPEGECGMYFAAKYILEKTDHHHKIDDFTRYFLSFAPSVSCKELKKMKVPFCAECLKKSVDYVDDVIFPN